MVKMIVASNKSRATLKPQPDSQTVVINLSALVGNDFTEKVVKSQESVGLD